MTLECPITFEDIHCVLCPPVSLSIIILGMNSAAYLTTLHRLLDDYFTLEEIRTLCLNLGIDYESVPGEEKQSRIRELLLGLGRHSRLTDLIPLLQQERPLVDWLPVPDDFQLPESLAAETVVPTNQYHLYGEMVQGDKVDGDKITIGNISDESVVAAGAGAVAVGSRGVYVRGNVYGSIHTGDVINYYITGAQTYFPQFTATIESFFTYYLGTEKEPVPFGGRNQELAQLDNWLDQESTQRLLLVAPAGRGKSALLARWSQRLTTIDNLNVVFMPISLRFNTNREDNTFVILATRLAHFYGKQIPTNYANQSPQMWRGLVAEYLREPLPDGRQLLLILDGLDEAAWDVADDLLPLNLPTMTRVVVSARYLGGEEQTPEPWLRRLGWDRFSEFAKTIELDTLSRQDVRDVLERAGFLQNETGSDDEIVMQLYEVSEGDPLLLELYIKDLWQKKECTARLRLEGIKNVQPGYKGYFKKWWEDQKKLWDKGDPLEKELINNVLEVLAMALGSLLISDLRQLLPEQVRSRALRHAIRPLNRFIIGDGKKQGFVFSHPKLAEYFRDELDEDEQEAWQECFLAWGRRTLANLQAGSVEPRDVPQYLMSYYGRHLQDANADVDDLLQLVSWNWMRVWHKETGTYSGFLQDVDRVWSQLRVANEADAEHAESIPFIGQEVLCALCHVSINSVTNIPDELLILLLQRKVWTEEQVVTYLRQRHDLEKRCRAFALILPYLSKDVRVTIEQELLTILEGFEVETLRQVLPTVARALPAKALAAAQRIDDEQYPIEVLLAVASQLPERTLATVRNISDSWGQMDVMMAIAPRLPKKTLETALEIGIDFTWRGVDLLVSLVSELPQEILAVTEKMGNERDRTTVLIALAPHLPAEVFAASQALADEKKRADIWVALAPRLSTEVLTASRALTDKLCRAEVLVSAISYLPDLDVHMRASQFREALNDARSIGEEDHEDHIYERLARLLISIAPQLPEEEQPAVWQEAIEAAQKIGKKLYMPKAWDDLGETEAMGSSRQIHRATVLAEIAQHVPVEMQPYVWKKAFDTAEGMMSQWQPVDLIATIAPHIPMYALEATRGMRGERYQVPVLVAIAPSLPQEVFAAAQEIGNEVTVLEAVAPYLPQESLQDLLGLTRDIHDPARREKLLVAVAPHLLEETLAVAQEINDEVERAGVLEAIAPYLPKEVMSLTSEICDETSRSYVLAAIASDRPWEVLTAARGIKDARSRMGTLKSVIPYLPIDVRSTVAEEVLASAREIEDEEVRAVKLASVIPHLEEKSRLAVLEEAMATARHIKAGAQFSTAELLVYFIAPEVPEEMRAIVWEKARKAVNWILNDSLKEAVIAAIDKSEPPLPSTPPVSENEKDFKVILEEVVVACAIENDWERAKMLAHLVEQTLHIDLSELYMIWRVTILALSQRKRPSLFSDIKTLMPMIYKLGGETAVRDTLQAVQAVSTWWP